MRWCRSVHQFEITKNSEPSNRAVSSSAAHTTEIEGHRLSLLWIMNPAPQPAARHYSRNAILSVESRTPFSDRGVLLEEHRGDFSTESFLFREWPWGRRIRSARPFRERAFPPGPTRSSGLPWTRAEAPKSLALNARDKRRPHEPKRCQHKTDRGLQRLQSFRRPHFPMSGR